MGDLRFDGQVIIVTGAGGGMGRAHALLLASRGATVVVNDLGSDVSGGGADDGPARRVVDEIVAAGGAATPSSHDIASRAGCEALVTTTVERLGRVDAIIHNAGTATFHTIADLDEATFDAVLSVHLRGGFFLTHHVWPHFVRQGGGRLLYITSEAGLYGSPRLAHYATAKIGLVALAKVAHHEGLPLGISANALGVLAYTRMTSFQIEEPARARWWQRYLRPELTSPAAAWLVHPDCPASGQVYQAFGGRVGRVAIAEGRGFAKLDLTLEDVRDHWPEIQQVRDWFPPEDSGEFWDHAMLDLHAVGLPPEPDVTSEAPG